MITVININDTLPLSMGHVHPFSVIYHQVPPISPHSEVSWHPEYLPADMRKQFYPPEAPQAAL